jgi:hypothetical protein
LIGLGLLDLVSGAGAFVGQGGRHPDVEDDEVGLVARHRGDEVARVASGGGDLVAAILEQARRALAQQHLILGDHDPHGSSAVTVVPRSSVL